MNKKFRERGSNPRLKSLEYVYALNRTICQLSPVSIINKKIFCFTER